VLLELIRGRETGESPDVLLERKAAYFLELVRQRDPLFPAIPMLVSDLAARYRLAVASGSLRTAIGGVLALRGLRQHFGPTVSVQDVARGKPAPDLFLRAAELLGIAPAACVVIEDSVPGVNAARAAGMRVIAITNTTPAERLAEADAVVSDYDAVRRLLLAAV
jgi:beta-phosphoglucomutase-like phosphatase (HAD superfamily)